MNFLQSGQCAFSAVCINCGWFNSVFYSSNLGFFLKSGKYYNGAIAMGFKPIAMERQLACPKHVPVTQGDALCWRIFPFQGK